MKSLNQAKPWGPKDFFSGVRYHTHNPEVYIPKPGSIVIPMRPPPAERTKEDQLFHLFPRHPDVPWPKASLHHLKLDLASAFNFSWRTVHNDMLMKMLDEDQKVALLHSPFKDIILFRGELAKLQNVNTEHASSLTVFPAPAARHPTYARKPYTGHGR